MLFYRVFVVGIMIHIFVGGCQWAAANPIVDQDFSSTASPMGGSGALSLTGDTLFAQSFTVGIGGLLAGGDLLVFDGTPFFGAGSPRVSDLTVQIRTLVAGFPTDIVLVSAIVPASNLQVQTVPFDSVASWPSVDAVNGPPNGRAHDILAGFATHGLDNGSPGGPPARC